MEANRQTSRHRGCVHLLCAVILALAATPLILKTRPAVLLARQIRLSAPTAFVVYHPDSHTLITESTNATTQTHAINFWNADSGQWINQLEQPSPIYSAAFSLDGKTLAVGADNAAYIWNLAARQVVFELRPETAQSIEHISFSPDGRWIATLSKKTLAVWDSHSGQIIEQIDTGTSTLPGFDISPDSTAIVYIEHANAAADEQICIWRPVTKGDEQCFRIQETLRGQVAWSPNGSQIALGSYQGAQFWRLPDGATEHIRFADDDWANHVFSLAFNPVEPLIAMSAKTNGVVIRNTKTGEKVADLGSCDPFVRRCFWTNLAFSPDGQSLALQYMTQDDDSAAIQIYRPNNGRW